MVSFSQTGLQNMFQNMPPEHATRTCHQNMPPEHDLGVRDDIIASRHAQFGQHWLRAIRNLSSHGEQISRSSRECKRSPSASLVFFFDLAPTRQEFIFVRCVQSSSEPTHLPPTPVPTSERTCHIVLSNTAIDCVRCAQPDVHHARRTASVELQFVRTLPSVPYPSMRSPFIRSPSLPTCTDLPPSSPSHRYHPRDPLSCLVVSSTTTTLEQRDVYLRVVLSPLIANIAFVVITQLGDPF